MSLDKMIDEALTVKPSGFLELINQVVEYYLPKEERERTLQELLVDLFIFRRLARL